MHDPILSKIEILLQQEKYVEAERLLHDLLRSNPNDAHLLMLLAEVKLRQDEIEASQDLIERAIGVSPDNPDLFFTQARILMLQNQLSKAEESITQAVDLYPFNSNYFALWAHIKMGQKKYEEALGKADQALEIDAENLLALNARSAALNKLNRAEEAFETIEGALREDPNSAYTHANYGWGLLEQAKYEKALEHFKESLSHDPNYDYAQAGMLEAIKAKNPVYRGFLKYSFWIGNLTAKYQWAVIIGFYAISRIISNIAQTNESLGNLLMPVVYLLALMAFSTWVIAPISNLFLRFNKYGKMLLSTKEKWSSNFVAGFLVIGLVGLIGSFLTDERFIALFIYGLAMMIPCSLMFRPAKYKNIFLYLCIALGIVGAAAIVETFTIQEIPGTLGLAFGLGIFGFQILSNFLLIQEDNPV